MPETLTKSLFAGHLHTRFELLHPVRKVEVELEEVASLSSDPHNDASFSLLFVAPGREYVEQAIYRLQHEVLGDLELFLVPIRHDARGVHYEALFNRMPIRQPLDRQT